LLEFPACLRDQIIRETQILPLIPEDQFLSGEERLPGQTWEGEGQFLYTLQVYGQETGRQKITNDFIDALGVVA
jgi:hypothetical protein